MSEDPSVTQAVTNLTGTAQMAANQALGGLEELSNSIFDAGEGGLQDALAIVDALQTSVSNVTTTIVAKVTGVDVPELPTVPTAEIAGKLTSGAQTAANKTLEGLSQFGNAAYDLGENQLGNALRIADAAQKKVTDLFGTITGLIEAQLSTKQ